MLCTSLSKQSHMLSVACFLLSIISKTSLRCRCPGAHMKNGYLGGQPTNHCVQQVTWLELCDNTLSILHKYKCQASQKSGHSCFKGDFKWKRTTNHQRESRPVGWVKWITSAWASTSIATPTSISNSITISKAKAKAIHAHLTNT